MSLLLLACIVFGLVVSSFVFAALVLASEADDIKEDMARRDADILARLRPTVDRSPSGPVADAEAP